MSSPLASSEEELDLVCALEEALESKGERKWRAKESLNINKARRQQDREHQYEKAKQEKKEKAAKYKEIAEEEAAKAGPLLQMQFTLVSEGTAHVEASSPDFKIICKKAEFFVHRNILARHSAYFKNMLPLPGNERNLAELEIKGEHPLTTLLVIKFCYSGHHDIHAAYDSRILDAGSKPKNLTNPLMIHAKVVAAAEKYAMPTLKELAITAFREDLSGKLANAWEAALAFYQRMAGNLLSVMKYSGASMASRKGSLGEFILETWTKDDCKLARGYTTEEDFYDLLYVSPEVVRELVRLSPIEDERYDQMRRRVKKMKEVDRQAEIKGFFKPFALHQPVSICYSGTVSRA